MSKRDIEDWIFEHLGLVGAAGFVVLCTIAMATSWYQATLQSKAWEREGIHVTPWEIVWGVQPKTTPIKVERKDGTK